MRDEGWRFTVCPELRRLGPVRGGRGQGRGRGAGRSSIPDAQIYREQFHLGRLVEPLGFDSLWTVEHHFTPYTMINNPTQFLAYFAGCTTRIDMGTMVVVLPWHDPVQVAEGFVALDHMLDGRRLKVGMGRGLGIREYNGHARADGRVARAVQGVARRAARRADRRVVLLRGRVPQHRPHLAAPAAARRTTRCSTTSTSPGAAPRRCRWPRTRTASRCSSRSGSGRSTSASSANTTASASRSTAGSRSARRSSAGCTAPRPTPRPRKARASTCPSTATARFATTSSSASTCRG